MVSERTADIILGGDLTLREGPIMHLRLLQDDMIVLSHPDDAEELVSRISSSFLTTFPQRIVAKFYSS